MNQKKVCRFLPVYLFLMDKNVRSFEVKPEFVCSRSSVRSALNERLFGEGKSGVKLR